MRRTLFTVATLITLSLPALAQFKPDVIYGEDDRLDLYQVQDQKLLELADSTVGLFYGRSVSMENETARLQTTAYGPGGGFCQEEPFYDQFEGAFCSGSLIGPDLVMTAGHCVMTQPGCELIKFVFGFSIKDPSVKNPNEVPASEVYGCKKLIGRDQVNSGADWALIQLDRPVANHKPLTLNRSENPVDGTPLVVIGHPAGLPTKVAGGATVRNASPEGYFVANLDTYGGNSGSAVFNAQTGLIEGILVRGENDFTLKPGSNCRVSNRCPSDGCRGEDVTKISIVIPQLPGQAESAVRVSPLAGVLSAAAEKLNSVRTDVSFDNP